MAESQKHILVAEDNAVNQRVLQYMLTKMGLRVDIAHDGAQAIQKTQVGRYDCVLMDMMMPNVNGLIAAQTIRENEKNGLEYLPIIALTANADPSNERKCLEAGMDAFLSKPFTYDQLLQCIESLVGPINRPTTSPPIDENVLSTFVKTMGDDDLGFIQELFSDFILETNRIRSDIHVGIASSNATAIARAAHSLKGSASVVGAVRLVRMSIEFESYAKRGKLDDILLRMSHFEGAINEVRYALDAFFKRLQQAAP